MEKVIDYDQLKSIRQQHPESKIVHCHGVFDLFHYGHLAHLKSAKKFGDLLVLTLTPDQFVNKGPHRPRYTEDKRLALLAALEFVDYVCVNRHPKAVQAIRELKPDFYVKGPDYRDMAADLTGGILEEERAVQSTGGKIVFTNDETESSSKLINQYFHSFNSEQKRMLGRIQKEGGLEKSLQIIESLSSFRVLIVGEPIIDTYVFCKPDALSSKSPTVSTTYEYQEDYAGGSLAIANHLSAMGCDVSIMFSHGNEPHFLELLKNSLSSKVKVIDHVVAGCPTPRKTRYLVSFRTQQIFEIQNVRADQWMRADPSKVVQNLKEISPNYDVMIAADFGHGFFEGDVLRTMEEISTFIGLNVQTNSGNFGYNPFTKHKRYDYLSLDERECRLALHNRFTPIGDLALKVAEHYGQRPTSVTLGTAGSVYFDETGSSTKCPIFFSDVVDTIGAGDAYFALSTLLVKAGAPKPLIPFLGNCYAGLKARTMGNKFAVSKLDLIRTVTSLLK